MSSTCRHRSGDTNEVSYRCSSTYPIEKGDICVIDPTSGVAIPAHLACAAALLSHGSVVATQANVAQYFGGVAMEKVGLQSTEKSFRLVTDSPTVRLATSGIFEFDCAASEFDAGAGTTFPVPGDPVGIHCVTSGVPTNIAGTANSQTVMKADNTGGYARDRAIGVVRPQTAQFPAAAAALTGPLNPAQTRVFVEIAAGYPYGGPKTIGVHPGTTAASSGQ
jgi:hypothetical protein